MTFIASRRGKPGVHLGVLVGLAGYGGLGWVEAPGQGIVNQR